MSTEVVVGVVAAYLLVYVVWGRTYYARRHGVRLGWGVEALFARGSIGAIAMGVIWPVSIVWQWSPEPCGHRKHQLARAQAQAQAEHEEALLGRMRER